MTVLAARAWSDAGRSIQELDPELGRVPDGDGLADRFEWSLAEDRAHGTLWLVADQGGAVVDGRREKDPDSASGSTRASAQRQHAGTGRPESASTVVERAQVIVEIHVQVLAARGLGVMPGAIDQLGADAPAP